MHIRFRPENGDGPHIFRILHCQAVAVLALALLLMPVPRAGAIDVTGEFPMRHILRFLIIVLLAGMPLTTLAEDLYLGRVIAVDRDSGMLSVAIVETEEAGESKSAVEKQVNVMVPKGQASERLTSGSIIRIWGNLSDKEMTLEASRVILTRQGARGKDPTGVRRRIGKSRGAYGGKGRGRGHGGR